MCERERAGDHPPFFFISFSELQHSRNHAKISLLATAVVTAERLVSNQGSRGVQTLAADLAVETLAVPHSGPGTDDLVVHENLGVAARALVIGSQALGLRDSGVSRLALQFRRKRTKRKRKRKRKKP